MSVDPVLPRGSHRFPKSLRLLNKAQFDHVYDGRQKVSRGPLTIFGRGNALAESRLGLSVSRRVGTAVRRNRIRRLLREAFRLSRQTMPAGFDWVIVVRPHAPLTLTEYQSLLTDGAAILQERSIRPAAT